MHTTGTYQPQVRCTTFGVKVTVDRTQFKGLNVDKLYAGADKNNAECRPKTVDSNVFFEFALDECNPHIEKV
jgi:hypothetical protein